MAAPGPGGECPVILSTRPARRTRQESSLSGVDTAPGQGDLEDIGHVGHLGSWEDAMTLSIFARIGDIKGESHDSRHRDEIEVLSWLWGLSQSTTAGRPGGAGGGGGRTGRPTVHGLTFTHSVDRASPLLMKACAR